MNQPPDTEDRPSAAAPSDETVEKQYVGPRREGRPPRRRILRSIAALPALFTLMNGLAGFGAIHFSTKDALGQASSGGAPLGNLVIAAWLIFAAMVFDMLDGRVARMTRRTSDFGGQLDSLCDVISFGVAPPLLMVRTAVMALRGGIGRIDFLPSFLVQSMIVERVVWCVAAVYVACAVLRLARFNVENEPDESAHMDFRGLPSPGAAAAIACLVLLFDRLEDFERGWRSSDWALATVGIALPIVTLATALLMVSRLRYVHMVNQYIRGRRPFSYLVKLIVLVVAMLLAPFVTVAALVLAYTLSGPVIWVRTAIRGGRKAA